MSEVLALGEVPSRCPVPQLRAASRIDPFWDGLWGLGAMASWTPLDLGVRQAQAGLVRLPAWWPQASGAEAVAEFMAPDGDLRARLELLGAVHSWRTLTTQQAATFLGQPQLVGMSRPVRTAFGARMLDVGVFTTGLVTTSLQGAASLVRPARSDVVTREVHPHLSIAERCVLTGGAPWRTGGQYDRHNLLAAELALRAGELCPQVATVLGEQLASVDHLLGSGLGRTLVPPSHNFRADAVLVRQDGMRIAVELTASAVMETFERRVRRWVEAMGATTFARSGLVLLIVCAPHPDRSSEHERTFVSRLRKVVAKVCRQYPGAPGERPADRIAIASWEDWFPLPGTLTSGFLTLRAHRPAGPFGNPWEEVDLLDDFALPFDPIDPEQVTAVIRGAAATATPPFWLRQVPDLPVLANAGLAAAGRTHPPVAFPEDPRRAAGYLPGVFTGAGASASYPVRLRSEPSVRTPADPSHGDTSAAWSMA